MRNKLSTLVLSKYLSFSYQIQSLAKVFENLRTLGTFYGLCFQLVVSGITKSALPQIFSHYLHQIMFKLLASVKFFSRCTTLHSAGGNSGIFANSYAKPPSIQLIHSGNEVATWIESLNEADKKKVRYIQNEV